MFRNNITH